MNLLSLLTGSLSSTENVNQLSNNTGLSDKQIKKLLRIAIPMLLYALTANSKAKNGASSLVNALMQHKTDDSVNKQLSNADTVDGAKIIGHILGNNADTQIQTMAAQSGLTTKQVSSVLNNIAPSLLSTVAAAATGSAKKPAGPKVDLSDGIDMTDIMGIMSQMSGGTTNSSKVDGTALLSTLAQFMK